MNPLMMQLLVSFLSKGFQGGMTAAFMRPDQALPLDYTAESQGLRDSNREFMVSRDEHGLGQTNRGRTLLPEDARTFMRMGRSPAAWDLRQAMVARHTPRTRNWEARVEPMVGAGVLANAPGEPNVPMGGDMSWALHRLKQASDADLIGGVPTPEDRDLPAAWRDTSARLATQARRKGFDLTYKLANPGRLDPRAAQVLSQALRGIW